MAGDWIKMREDLHEDPAVLWIAQEMEVEPELVVGLCHRFWGLVSRQTRDGCLTGPSLESLGRAIGRATFPSLLREVGWLEHDDSGDKPITTIPKFERHLSQGSKNRALAAERKRKQRHDNVPKVSRTDRDKSVTREEKRREEYKEPTASAVVKKPPPPRKVIPPPRDQVELYFAQIGLGPTEVDKFMNHWDSQGWRRGQTKLKDWQAAARTWRDRAREFAQADEAENAGDEIRRALDQMEAANGGRGRIGAGTDRTPALDS